MPDGIISGRLHRNTEVMINQEFEGGEDKSQWFQLFITSISVIWVGTLAWRRLYGTYKLSCSNDKYGKESQP